MTRLTESLGVLNDTMEKLPLPEKRPGARSIKSSPRDSVLGLRSFDSTIPRGNPGNLLTNIDLRKVLQRDELPERLQRLLADAERQTRPVHAGVEQGQYDGEPRELAPALPAFNQAPDFIEDHGHDSCFGDPGDAEKRALIEFMKTI